MKNGDKVKYAGGLVFIFVAKHPIKSDYSVVYKKEDDELLELRTNRLEIVKDENS